MFKARITVHIPHVMESEHAWEQAVEPRGYKPKLIRTISSRGEDTDTLAIIDDTQSNENVIFDKLENMLRLARKGSSNGIHFKVAYLFPCDLSPTRVLYSEVLISFTVKAHQTTGISDICKQFGIMARRELPLKNPMVGGMEWWEFVVQSLGVENSFEAKANLTAAYANLPAAINIFGAGQTPKTAIYKIVKDTAFK